MSESLGSLCIVLHAHLPYVLHHGVHPHGEAWLYEAAAEAYLPLLEMLDELSRHKIRASLTVGLTPVLLEQLAHPHFKMGFVAYLEERIERARRDAAEFSARCDDQFVFLAQRWEKWYSARLRHFEHIERDIVGRFKAAQSQSHVQMLTSSATHAYLPLLLNDAMLTAQLMCGTATSQRRLGASAAGMWLPECGYRSTNPRWTPPVLYDDPRYRAGIETFVAAAGCDHFFVDSHLVQQGVPLGTYDQHEFRQVGEAQLYWDLKRGWRSPLEPVGVASAPEAPKCFALARHPRVSEQVWSSAVGYPSAGDYLEFHRKHGNHGLRYHRVTDPALPAAAKAPYVPENTFDRLYEHSRHFCQVVRQTLQEHKQTTGRAGVVTAPFDAELFGHWWFEGPQFLRDVILTLSRDPTVRLTTSEEALALHPADKVMRLGDGSWGAEGNHSVWLNDQTGWMWEMEYRAEGRLLHLLHALPWRKRPRLRSILESVARELLLLQSSDWPFIVHHRVAQDYGIQRFIGHYTRFDRLASIAQHLAAGHALSPIQQTVLDEAAAHDVIFSDIDLNWWMAGRGE